MSDEKIRRHATALSYYSAVSMPFPHPISSANYLVHNSFGEELQALHNKGTGQIHIILHAKRHLHWPSGPTTNLKNDLILLEDSEERPDIDRVAIDLNLWL